MEQIFPEIKIVDLKALRQRAGAFLSGVWNVGRHVELCLSEHNRGASPMLDAALDVQPQLPFGDTIDRRRQPTASFDDCGRYMTAEGDWS